MKASELRVGNLIYRKGGTEVFNDGRPEVKRPNIVVEVKNIFIDGVIEGVNASWIKSESRYVFDPPLWNAEPIPLTKEWLVRLGFVKSNNPSKGFEDSYSLNDILINSDDVYPNRDMETQPLRIKLKHVHQLQNLYFALTGEELMFKTNN